MFCGRCSAGSKLSIFCEYAAPVISGPIPDAAITRLNKLGFNHVCFAVEDIEAEVRRLNAAGIEFRNEVMEFHDRKLVFLCGPGGITVELAQWLTQ